MTKRQNNNSTKKNFPSYSISLGSKHPNMVITSLHTVELLGRDSPGVGNYNIDSELIKRSQYKNIGCSFGKAARPVLSQVDHDKIFKTINNLNNGVIDNKGVARYARNKNGVEFKPE